MDPTSTGLEQNITDFPNSNPCSLANSGVNCGPWPGMTNAGSPSPTTCSVAVPAIAIAALAECMHSL
eukprot:CAMPEP_0114261770 /NCGR_PEP_ID=MMETSP0058-20121206/21351_1 /TAXON_ID=36894 /ORGANISM="Pyramimonas parkeae, CCMP726" /LENGTH=66 /DNA_ID=CAMNT_0001377401 /DNA_START=218 /DNA_END=418 /DNA_ORIENTATION=+